MRTYISFGLFAILLTLALVACKNDKPAEQAATTAELPPPKNDSLVGFKGCERAGFLAINSTTQEFKYQHHKFRIIDSETSPGDRIEAYIDTLNLLAKVPDVEPTYFKGFSRGHFFVDIGQDPEVREVIVYSLVKGVLSQVYRTPYMVIDTPFVANGSFWFYRPIEQSELPEGFECPEELKDQNVIYGQRYLYHMDNRGLTRKSEFRCAPTNK